VSELSEAALRFHEQAGKLAAKAGEARQ